MGKIGKKDAFLISIVVGIFLSYFFIPRFGQNPDYHNFADKRLLFGIPHFFDVFSNILFLIAGVYGVYRFHKVKISGPARYTYLVFLLGLILTCFGSGYYHWQPSTERLFWDRMPMTIAFMGFLNCLISLRISQSLGKKLSIPMILLGFATVIYWSYTESLENGDLRPYVILQMGMLLLTVVIMLLYKGDHPSNSSIWILFIFYVAAKVTESFDHKIYELTYHQMSGHSIKHLLAGIGAWTFVKKQI